MGKILFGIIILVALVALCYLTEDMNQKMEAIETKQIDMEVELKNMEKELCDDLKKKFNGKNSDELRKAFPQSDELISDITKSMEELCGKN